MRHLVEFPLEEGSSIVVEVDEPELTGTVRAARGDTLAKTKETLEDALNKILPATKSVVQKLRDMDSKPDEVEVSFGVKLTTTVGAVIASGSAEANFAITLRWAGKAKEAPS